MSLQRARALLEGVGVAVEGNGGRSKLLRAAYIGSDYGIEPERWIQELQSWNAKNVPPWNPRELEREVISMYGSAKKPFGCKGGPSVAAWTPPKKDFPPIDEVRALWSAALEVDASPHVSEYIAAHIGPPSKLATLNKASHGLKIPVARALEPGADGLPSWAKQWPERGYRLLTPLFDVHGVVRSVAARNITHPDRWKQGDSKVRTPQGSRVDGLFFASPHAVASLRGDVPKGLGIRRWTLVEGDKDTLIDIANHAHHGVAVIGKRGQSKLPNELFSWLVTHVPAGNGPDVFVRMDADSKGREYTREILPKLKGCKVMVPNDYEG